MSWLGLDIGGANLKAADGRGWARGEPFALWRNPDGLAEALSTLAATAPGSERWAVTMTGELCDCFRTKTDGVLHILASVKAAAGPCEVVVYLIDGRFVSLDEARELPQLAAASNWHALARFACRYLNSDESGVLIDVGSTTTDIVPLVDGRPCSGALDDTVRLLAGELVYTGVSRTPICAVTRSLPWRGRQCPVTAELFATTADAYVFLGQLPEQPAATWTADGRPLTREFARERLARMICTDTVQFNDPDAHQAAAAVQGCQLAQLRDALGQVIGAMEQAPTCFVVSGQGEFLGRESVVVAAAGVRCVSLKAELGYEASACAPAHALAVLAKEALGRPGSRGSTELAEG